MFSKEDLQHIHARGITPDKVENQINIFKTGFPFIRLTAPATRGNGIIAFTDEEAHDMAQFFDDNKHNYQLIKFVPASGAASRMFKHLLAFRNAFKGNPEEIDKLEQEEDFNSTGYFFRNIRKFAFYEPLKKVMAKKGMDLEILLQNKDYNTILDYLLTEKGLHYASLPKALLHFHSYPGGPRKAFEEHLVEAAHYAVDDQQVAHLHFTVSKEHQDGFDEAIEKVLQEYEREFGVKFSIHFSQQKPRTDTLAVDMDNEPFRNADGSLLFRPGGHGALIENLNELNTEIIFIKNIDNIVPDYLRETTYLYKKCWAVCC